MVGVNPEFAHEQMAGLSFFHAVAQALEAGKLFHIDLNDQKPGRFDQDLRFGSESIKPLFFLVKLLEERGYDGPRHFDAHAYRTEDEEGVWDFARGCMRTYLILKEKARAFAAHPGIQALLAEIRGDGRRARAVLARRRGAAEGGSLRPPRAGGAPAALRTPRSARRRSAARDHLMARGDETLYLGLDCSTQSLSAVVLEASGGRHRVVLERSLAFDDALPHYGTRHGVLPAADPAIAACLAGDVGGGARPPDGRDRRERPRPAAARGHLGLGAAARERVSQRRRHPRPRAPRSVAAAAAADRAAPVAAGRADLDGLEHARRVRGDRGGRGRRRDAGAAHRIARVRALHRPADPQVRHVRARRLRGHRSHPPGELVSRLGAHRPPGAGRSRRRVGDEPDGPRLRRVVAAGARRDRAGSPAPAPGHRAVVGHRRPPVALLAVPARAARGEGGRVVRRQPVQPHRPRPGPRGTRRRLARHQRHDLRRHARAARRHRRHRARVRVAHRRLHGHHGVQQRLAGARARARSLRPDLGRLLARARGVGAGQRRRADAAVVRARDHTHGGRRRGSGAAASTSTMRPPTCARWWRRR